MTVQECIDKYKNNTTRKLTSIWICPEIVTNGRVGKNYTCECGIGARLDEGLTQCEVTKYWVETNVLCMIYKPQGEPFVFAAS